MKLYVVTQSEGALELWLAPDLVDRLVPCLVLSKTGGCVTSKAHRFESVQHQIMTPSVVFCVFQDLGGFSDGAGHELHRANRQLSEYAELRSDRVNAGGHGAGMPRLMQSSPCFGSGTDETILPSRYNRCRCRRAPGDRSEPLFQDLELASTRDIGLEVDGLRSSLPPLEGTLFQLTAKLEHVEPGSKQRRASSVRAESLDSLLHGLDVERGELEASLNELRTSRCEEGVLGSTGGPFDP
jgi:hypothetical protein